MWGGSFSAQGLKLKLKMHWVNRKRCNGACDQALQRIESASQTIGPGNHQKLFAVAPQPRSPGSSNNRFRLWLRTI